MSAGGLAVAGFITISLVGGAQPWVQIPVAPVTIQPAPVPRTLSGWKELIQCSVANGGPSTEQHLRRLAVADARAGRWCPIMVAPGGRSVACVDIELIQWLKLRRKPLGWRQLGTEPRAKTPGSGRRSAK